MLHNLLLILLCSSQLQLQTGSSEVNCPHHCAVGLHDVFCNSAFGNNYWHFKMQTGITKYRSQCFSEIRDGGHWARVCGWLRLGRPRRLSTEPRRLYRSSAAAFPLPAPPVGASSCFPPHSNFLDLYFVFFQKSQSQRQKGKGAPGPPGISTTQLFFIC